MFYKEKSSIYSIFSVYDKVELSTRHIIENFDLKGKIQKEAKKIDNFKIHALLILIFNFIFRGVLFYLGKETLFSFLATIPISILSYILITFLVKVRREDVELINLAIKSDINSINKIKLSSFEINELISKYKESYIDMKIALDVAETEDSDGFERKIMRMGKFLIFIFSIIYVVLSISVDKGMNSIIILSILAMYSNVKLTSISQNTKRIVLSFFKIELINYPDNLNKLEELYNESLTVDNEVAFECYSTMLYMLLDLYQDSMDEEYIKNETINYLPKVYYDKIEPNINKIYDKTLKESLLHNLSLLKDFMKSDLIKLYDELEPYIGSLYSQINKQYPNNTLKIENYCLTEEQLEALTLLCE